MTKEKGVNKNAKAIILDAENKGLTHKEISDICSVTVHTVSRWKNKGKAKAKAIESLERYLLSGRSKDHIGVEYEKEKQLTEVRILIDNISSLIAKEESEILRNLAKYKLLMLNEEILSLGKRYQPHNEEEFMMMVATLFSDNLVKLRATSIFLKDGKSRKYWQYWSNTKTGRFFKEKNEVFAKSQGGYNLQRIFLCESLSEFVKEEFFIETVMKHVRKGIAVKVHEIEKSQLQTYEDFGIYYHTLGDKTHQYVLLAPLELNQTNNNELQTILISDLYNESTVQSYIQKFDYYWGSSSEQVSIVEGIKTDFNYERGSEKTGSIIKCFNKVILRDLKIIDSEDRYSDRSESLIDKYGQMGVKSDGFLRKFQEDYARIIFQFINDYYHGIDHIIYFGDTVDNDGSLIRNLQSFCKNRTGIVSGIKDVSGFICEPALKLDNVWFNNLYYSSKWSHLLGFLSCVKNKILEPKTLVIFDLDQTLWAPKGNENSGGHELPLKKSRKEAMRVLIQERYFDVPTESYKSYWLNLAELVYDMIGGLDYNRLTQDNEDYKVAISVFVGLKMLEEGIPVAFGLELAKANARKAVEEELRDYKDRPDQKGFVKFMQDILLKLAAHKDPEKLLKEYGLKNKYYEDVVSILSNLTSNMDTVFNSFRDYEYKCACDFANPDGKNIDDIITLNKVTWDLAEILKECKVNRLVLSDRPRISTYGLNGGKNQTSLLDQEMRIRGFDLEEDMRKMLEVSDPVK